MLSAVENHFGPSRLYATGAHHHHHHPYTNNSGAAAIAANNSLIAAPCPIVAVPTPMSATEFARPHPKPNRYNGSQSLRNGLSSAPSRSKYSQVDQSAPVNLAVSQSLTDNGSLVLSHKSNDVAAALCAAAKPSSLESEQDAISSSIASLYQHKLPYGPSAPPPPMQDATSPLYYPNFYPRPSVGSVYGHSMYPPSLGGGRNAMHHGVATYPHVDSFNPYLFAPNEYRPPHCIASPPAAARPNLSPHSPIGTITVGSASQTNNNNTSISAQSVLPANTSSPLSVSPPSMFTQQSRDQQQSYHLKTSSEHSSSMAKPISTYRTEPKEKESNVSNNNGKAVDFKIPSGKEGSLKHRILTRPYGEKDGPVPKQANHKQSLPTHSQNNAVAKPLVKTKNSNSHSSSSSSSSNNNNNNNACSKNKNLTASTATSFSKGTLIELSSGELKRVEDMRTEDFVTSSNKNPNLQLINTTVVKMVSQAKNAVLITLSYNSNKFCMETQPSHPFFVYGKGWAAYSVEEALHEHGLKCQLLEVGDVCISLTPREQSKPPAPQSSETQSSVIGSPQNLSRKQIPQTISTTATGTAVTSRQIPSHYEPSPYSQHHHHPHHLHQQHQHHQPQMPRHHDAVYEMHVSGRPTVSEMRKFNGPMAPPPPPPSSSSASVLPDASEAIDATVHSRKRRTWSICEKICDDPKKSKAN